jgi:hypothetical protein
MNRAVCLLTVLGALSGLLFGVTAQRQTETDRVPRGSSPGSRLCVSDWRKSGAELVSPSPSLLRHRPCPLEAPKEGSIEASITRI